MGSPHQQLRAAKPARRILFLITTGLQSTNDNHLRLPRAFAAAGWQVTTAAHPTLAWQQGATMSGPHKLADFDLIWPVGLGPMAGFLDRAQLLAGVDPARMVIPGLAMTHLHSKTAWLEWAPASLVSHEPAAMAAWMAIHPGPWVIKPPAASYGRDVYLLHSPDQLPPTLARRAGEYWLIQQYVADITAGEMRTLVAGDQIIHSYRRLPAAGSFTANLSSGARAEAAELSDADRHLVQQVQARLQQYGLKFAAVDTCGGYVLEVNVANPGGLATLQDLYDRDFAPQVVAALTACLPA